MFLMIRNRPTAPPSYTSPVQQGDTVALWDASEPDRMDVAVVLEAPAHADDVIRLRVWDGERLIGIEAADGEGWIANPAVKSPWRNIRLPFAEFWMNGLYEWSEAF
jgi:hypothetical protein